MNDTVLGALIGAGATVIGAILAGVLVHWRDERRRRSVRATYDIALAQEMDATPNALRALLERFPHDGMAATTDSFFRGLSMQGQPGHLFIDLLPHLDVLPTEVTHGLSQIYLNLQLVRAQAQNVLDRGGSVRVPTGETDPHSESGRAAATRHARALRGIRENSAVSAQV